jgi:hypothetical protein
MANDISLTGLTEVLYQARDIVAQEPTGFAQGVIVNGGSEGVSAGGTVISMRTTEPTLETTYAPAMVPPDAADITTTAETLALSLFAGASIPLKGEQWAQLANTVGAEAALQALYAQAIRKMVNQIETTIATVAYQNSSRAVGTAGTTPFGSNFEVLSDLYRILEDNGTPMSDGMLSCVLNTAASANLRKRSTLTNVGDAGTDATLRRGELLNLFNMSIRSSAGVQSHTKGTGTGYLINNGNVAVGSTALTVDGGTAGGTGIKAGDVITVADDPSAGAYVVKTGLTTASGSLVINQPGLRGLIVNDKAVTVGDSYAANVAFHKNAIELAMRPPAQPPGGDAGEEIATLFDERTGLSFSARLYKGYGMSQIKLMSFYGVKAWKPEFIATLRG